MWIVRFLPTWARLIRETGRQGDRPPQCENHSWDFRVYYVNGRWGIPSLPRPFGLRHGPRQTKLPSWKHPSSSWPPRPPGVGGSTLAGLLSPGAWPRPATLTSAGGYRGGSPEAVRSPELLGVRGLSGSVGPLWALDCSPRARRRLAVSHRIGPFVTLKAGCTARRSLARSKTSPINGAAAVRRGARGMVVFSRDKLAATASPGCRYWREQTHPFIFYLFVFMT